MARVSHGKGCGQFCEHFHDMFTLPLSRTIVQCVESTPLVLLCLCAPCHAERLIAAKVLLTPHSVYTIIVKFMWPAVRCWHHVLG